MEDVDDDFGTVIQSRLVFICHSHLDNAIADEIYYYHTEAAAREHFNLFLDDDSDLYSVIRLESDCGKLIDCINFSMVEVI